MGFDPNAGSFEPPFDNSDNHLLMASARGLGTTDLGKIETVGASINDVKSDFKRHGDF
jgi:hypothetical protein